jgi:hypothetical protein
VSADCLDARGYLERDDHVVRDPGPHRLVLDRTGHELAEGFSGAVTCFGYHRILNLTEHVDVNDSILLVRIGDGPESEAEIEILEPALRCDPDGLAGRQ